MKHFLCLLLAAVGLSPVLAQVDPGHELLTRYVEKQVDYQVVADTTAPDGVDYLALAPLAADPTGTISLYFPQKGRLTFSYRLSDPASEGVWLAFYPQSAYFGRNNFEWETITIPVDGWLYLGLSFDDTPFGAQTASLHLDQMRFVADDGAPPAVPCFINEGTVSAFTAPFSYQLRAVGEGPLSFAGLELPPGVELDEITGQFSAGSDATLFRKRFRVQVSNASGSHAMVLQFGEPGILHTLLDPADVSGLRFYQTLHNTESTSFQVREYAAPPFDDTQCLMDIQADNRGSVINTTITGPATLHWHWRPNRWAFKDYAFFAIDEVLQPSVKPSISSDWTLVETQIPAGPHRISWIAGSQVSLDGIYLVQPGVARLNGPAHRSAFLGEPLQWTIPLTSPPVSFALAPADSLPPGVTLHPTSGVISGTPTGPVKQYDFTVVTTNANASVTNTRLHLAVCRPVFPNSGLVWRQEASEGRQPWDETNDVVPGNPTINQTAAIRGTGHPLVNYTGEDFANLVTEITGPATLMLSREYALYYS